MFIEDKIIYKMVEFWYNMNEQRNGGVAFLSTKPKKKSRHFPKKQRVSAFHYAKNML